LPHFMQNFASSGSALPHSLQNMISTSVPSA
jgi:hypothetical protein